jgi:hypothetical protein
MTNTHLTERLWQYVRGEMTSPELEQWVYATPELEGALGHDRYLELVSTDFSTPDADRSLRHLICLWLDPTGASRCRCLDWRDRQKIGLGQDINSSLQRRTRELARAQSLAWTLPLPALRSAVVRRV